MLVGSLKSETIPHQQSRYFLQKPLDSLETQLNTREFVFEQWVNHRASIRRSVFDYLCINCMCFQWEMVTFCIDLSLISHKISKIVQLTSRIMPLNPDLRVTQAIFSNLECRNRNFSKNHYRNQVFMKKYYLGAAYQKNSILFFFSWKKK